MLHHFGRDVYIHREHFNGINHRVVVQQIAVIFGGAKTGAEAQVRCAESVDALARAEPRKKGIADLVCERVMVEQIFAKGWIT